MLAYTENNAIENACHLAELLEKYDGSLKLLFQKFTKYASQSDENHNDTMRARLLLFTYCLGEWGGGSPDLRAAFAVGI